MKLLFRILILKVRCPPKKEKISPTDWNPEVHLLPDVLPSSHLAFSNLLRFMWGKCKIGAFLKSFLPCSKPFQGGIDHNLKIQVREYLFFRNLITSLMHFNCIVVVVYNQLNLPTTIVLKNCGLYGTLTSLHPRFSIN